MSISWVVVNKTCLTAWNWFSCGQISENTEGYKMDATVIGAIAAVTGSVIVFAVMVIRVLKLINTTRSED